MYHVSLESVSFFNYCILIEQNLASRVPILMPNARMPGPREASCEYLGGRSQEPSYIAIARRDKSPGGTSSLISSYCPLGLLFWLIDIKGRTLFTYDEKAIAII
jgi:hypothetical protein